jgi:hypothetical protein
MIMAVGRGPSLNYKYLRKRAWYKSFRLILLPFYIAIIPLNIWHSWRWHEETSFDYIVFAIGIFGCVIIISIAKIITVNVVEGKKAFLPPWNK